MSQVIIVMKKLQKKTSELIESLLEGEDISPSESSESSESRSPEEPESQESEFESALHDLLSEDGMRCQTYAEAGVTTRNKGLVVNHPTLGKFQVSIVQDHR